MLSLDEVSTVRGGLAANIQSRRLRTLCLKEAFLWVLFFSESDTPISIFIQQATTSGHEVYGSHSTTCNLQPGFVSVSEQLVSMACM